MSLVLDKRQRAMLREMGVRVWQPAPAAAAVSSPELPSAVLAEPAAPARAASVPPVSPHLPSVPVSAPSAQPAAPHAAPAAAQAPPASALEAVLDTAAGAWHGGTLRSLYPGAGEGAVSPAGHARWLVLVDATAAGLQADPLQGEAGVLLSHMLRAARLHEGAAVWLAPLARQSAAAEPAPALSGTLSAWVAQVQPDVVLVMGRLAAQALLASSEPFGKLRGQVHRLHGAAVIVTHDAPYLLRTPADKAKAWEDLCLALQQVSGTT